MATIGCNVIKKGQSSKPKVTSELAKLIDEEYANLDEQAIPGVVRARLGETKLSNAEIVDSVFKETTKGKLDTIPFMVWEEVEKFLMEHIEDSKYQVYQFDMADIYDQVVYLRTEREKKEKKGLPKVKNGERVISIAGRDYALDIAREIRKIYTNLRSQFKTKTQTRLTVNGYKSLKEQIIAIAKTSLNTNISAYKEMLRKRLDKML